MAAAAGGCPKITRLWTVYCLDKGESMWAGLISSVLACWVVVHVLDKSSQNCSIWPVLKHGPRSLTFVRVDGCFKLVGVTKVSAGIFAPATNWLIERGLSMSTCVRTRKMVNYAWVGRSQGKLWWRVVAILTCKSFVKPEYRGERLIEPSSSWFLSKFPSG